MLNSCHNSEVTRKHKRGFNQWQWPSLIHSNSLSKHAGSPGKAVKAVHRHDRKEIVSSFFFSPFHLHYVCFLSAAVLQKLIRPARHMRNLELIKLQHCVLGSRPATASTGARGSWLSSQSVPVSLVLVRQDVVWGVKMILKEAKMLIMNIRHCSHPDTFLPLPLYPFPLCPHGISCQLGSFPLLLLRLSCSTAPATGEASAHCSGWGLLQWAGTRDKGQGKHFLHLWRMDGG